MSDYVVGFLFSQHRSAVVLIRKNKPEWQAGRFNGVGGKIEHGETPIEAMKREFEEEAGVLISDWAPFITLSFSNGVRVYFFRHILSDDHTCHIKSQTDEKVYWCAMLPSGYVPGKDMLPNLKWLIPMALTGTKCGVLEIEKDSE